MGDYDESWNQSREHKIMIGYFYEVVSFVNLPVQKEKEYIAGDQRIDIFFELRNSKKVAIECQHSLLTVEELEDRTRRYNDKGFYVLWILSPKMNYLKRFDKYNKPNVVNITAIEKALHKMYRGRVYYFDREVENWIVPIHFDSYSEKRTNEWIGYDYTKYFKTKRRMRVDKLLGLDLVCNDNEDFMTAGFYTKRVDN